jgi:CcmD family protein
MFYLAAAFIGVWLLVMVYVVLIGRRQRALEQELRTVEEMVAEGAKRKPGVSN